MKKIQTTFMLNKIRHAMIAVAAVLGASQFLPSIALAEQKSSLTELEMQIESRQLAVAQIELAAADSVVERVLAEQKCLDIQASITSLQNHLEKTTVKPAGAKVQARFAKRQLLVLTDR